MIDVRISVGTVVEAAELLGRLGDVRLQLDVREQARPGPRDALVRKLSEPNPEVPAEPEPEPEQPEPEPEQPEPEPEQPEPEPEHPLAPMIRARRELLLALDEAMRLAAPTSPDEHRGLQGALRAAACRARAKFGKGVGEPFACALDAYAEALSHADPDCEPPSSEPPVVPAIKAQLASAAAGLGTEALAVSVQKRVNGILPHIERNVRPYTVTPQGGGLVHHGLDRMSREAALGVANINGDNGIACRVFWHGDIVATVEAKPQPEPEQPELPAAEPEPEEESPVWARPEQPEPEPRGKFRRTPIAHAAVIAEPLPGQFARAELGRGGDKLVRVVEAASGGGVVVLSFQASAKKWSKRPATVSEVFALDDGDPRLEAAAESLGAVAVPEEDSKLSVPVPRGPKPGNPAEPEPEEGSRLSDAGDRHDWDACDAIEGVEPEEGGAA